MNLTPGAFLSGAGSSILAITSGLRGEPAVQSSLERSDAAVAAAMAAAAGTLGTPGVVRVLQPSVRGAHLVASSKSAAVSPPGPMYISTRGGEPVSFEDAIMAGLAPNGGLYVPEKVCISCCAQILLAWKLVADALLLIFSCMLTQ